MSETKNLYMPYFYNWTDFTESLSDEEFGILIRALSKNAPDRTVPSDLPPGLVCIYKFMLDAVWRVIDSNGKGDKEVNKNINPNNNANTNANTNPNANANTNTNASVKGREGARVTRVNSQQASRSWAMSAEDIDSAFHRALERTYQAEKLIDSG